MATKADIQRHIAGKLRKSLETRRLTGPFVESAVLEHITLSDWSSIAIWVQANDFNAIGKHITQIVRSEINNNAMQEAAVIVADDTVSLAEYAKIENLP